MLSALSNVVVSSASHVVYHIQCCIYAVIDSFIFY